MARRVLAAVLIIAVAIAAFVVLPERINPTAQSLFNAPDGGIQRPDRASAP
jgi:hypothetical protein